jgi:predicted small secreted protein
MNKLILAALAMVACLTTACSTMEGLGEDINKAGNAISRAADNTRDKMHQPQ